MAEQIAEQESPGKGLIVVVTRLVCGEKAIKETGILIEKKSRTRVMGNFSVVYSD
jgi:hypothetical protein